MFSCRRDSPTEGFHLEASKIVLPWGWHFDCGFGNEKIPSSTNINTHWKKKTWCIKQSANLRYFNSNYKNCNTNYITPLIILRTCLWSIQGQKKGTQVELKKCSSTKLFLIIVAFPNRRMISPVRLHYSEYAGQWWKENLYLGFLELALFPTSHMLIPHHQALSRRNITLPYHTSPNYTHVKVKR